jgi:hypothetical protein
LNAGLLEYPIDCRRPFTADDARTDTRVSMHSLRRVFATHLLEQVEKIRTIQASHRGSAKPTPFSRLPLAAFLL